MGYNIFMIISTCMFYIFLLFATYYTYTKVRHEFSKSRNLTNQISILGIEILITLFAIEFCERVLNYFAIDINVNEFTIFLVIFALPATILRIIIYYDEISLKFRSLFNTPNETK